MAERHEAHNNSTIMTSQSAGDPGLAWQMEPPKIQDPYLQWKVRESSQGGVGYTSAPTSGSLCYWTAVLQQQTHPGCPKTRERLIYILPLFQLCCFSPYPNTGCFPFLPCFSLDQGGQRCPGWATGSPFTLTVLADHTSVIHSYSWTQILWWKKHFKVTLNGTE